MKELSIANFKYGLDHRREALTSLLGTLVTCENAHINPGGEVEKRKAFVDLGEVLTTAGGPSNVFTFIMVGDVGYVLYTSHYNPTINNSLGITVLPHTIDHPFFANGGAFNSLYHDIFEFRFVRVFNGKILTAVKFVDGNTFLYYDGGLVTQSAAGIVLNGGTSVSYLSSSLVELINELDEWSAIANTDQNGSAQAGTTIVKSPIANYYTPVITKDSADGQLGAIVVDKDSGAHTVASITRAGATATVTITAGHTFSVGQLVFISGADQTEYNGAFTVVTVTSTTFTYAVTGTPVTPATGTIVATSAVPAVKAKASFQVTSFVGTYTLTAPANSDGTGTAQLTGGAVTAITSTSVTADLIVQAVNDLTYVHGYTALKNATDSVFIYAPEAWGSSINGFNLTVTEAGGGSSGGGGSNPATMSATISPSPLYKEYVFNTAGTYTPSGFAEVTVSGGTGPYTYAWTETTTGSANGITILQNNAPIGYFSKTGVSRNTTLSGSYKCTVTDSLGAVAVAFLNITFASEVLGNN